MAPQPVVQVLRTKSVIARSNEFASDPCLNGLGGLRPKSPSDLVLSISPVPPWTEMESIWGHLWLNGWKWQISLEFDACDIGRVGRVKSSPTH